MNEMRMLLRLRKPCVLCGSITGYYVKRNDQNVAYCVCNVYQGYNVPKSEVGEQPRKVKSERSAVEPKQRHRILARDGNRCVECGVPAGIGAILCVGHIISVAEGHGVGLSDDMLFDDENLYTVCEECNLGRGKVTFDLPLLVKVLKVRLGRK